MSQSGNQRAMSSSHGSSRAQLGLDAELGLRVTRLLALRRHERVVGAALEVVDEVDRLALLREGEDRRQQAVAVAGALELHGHGVHRHDEVVEVRVAQDQPAVAELVVVGLDLRARLLGGSGQELLGLGDDGLKSAVPIGWKTTPAHSRLFSPRPVSIVTFAVVIANSRSGAAPFSLPFDPNRASRKTHRPRRPCPGAATRAAGGARSASPSAGASRRASGSRP